MFTRSFAAFCLATAVSVDIDFINCFTVPRATSTSGRSLSRSKLLAYNEWDSPSYSYSPMMPPLSIQNQDDLDNINKRASTSLALPLARIVAAYPSSGEQILGIHQISNVFVLEVDEQFMELQATICDSDYDELSPECSIFPIQVEFPRPCDSERLSLEECVLSNLDVLDHEADLILQHAEWDAMNKDTTNKDATNRDDMNNRDINNEDESQIRSKDMDLDMLNLDPDSQSKVNYPSWWIAPPFGTEMEHHCDTLCRLLNEDEFQSGIQKMAMAIVNANVSTLTKKGTGTQCKAQEAAVVAVGPAGIILRVWFTMPDSNSVKGVTTRMAEVTRAFPSEASNVEQLRNLVSYLITFLREDASPRDSR
mmetsp:Transcript_45164/g.54747  ORF Transcript_45164/g.54747 Transcript_45164/m.54747 type:complete len:366 (-) Transcript_45164:113-1210(-)|eukprot:CAMPEP_0172497934 /NCGR_PEP_ID=MMETSP1066-20121228/107177_1 /TAXON_ID=671091 /ORGANISM="Coscinodiscus wailesii, Strain CCMP2513" /LENGTH=365 /DNA_ID=CAMNT_0013270979 /DNA_START=72 /DNA_END=1169 /DNA_ORIENTATION=-